MWQNCNAGAIGLGRDSPPLRNLPIATLKKPQVSAMARTRLYWSIM